LENNQVNTIDNDQEIEQIKKLMLEIHPYSHIDLSLLTKKDIMGLLGELYVYLLWLSICPKLGLKVVHKGINSYNKRINNDKRRVIDFVIRRKSALFIANEVKNANTPKERYSYLDLAERDISDRFAELKPYKKLLTISNFDAYADRVQQKVTGEDTDVFELGKVITLEDFGDDEFFEAKSKELFEYVQPLVQQYIAEKSMNRNKWLESNGYFSGQNFSSYHLVKYQDNELSSTPNNPIYQDITKYCFGSDSNPISNSLSGNNLVTDNLSDNPIDGNLSISNLSNDNLPKIVSIENDYYTITDKIDRDNIENNYQSSYLSTDTPLSYPAISIPLTSTPTDYLADNIKSG
jgi:hypothetical protein